MSRWQAFAIHLGISLAIFAVLAALVLFVWYPSFFFTTDGGWQGMRIIVLVDLVLGPLLTLLIYKAGKPGLRFDLTVIALIQVLGLSGGVYVVYSERPLALVYSDGQFNSLARDDFQANDLDPALLDRYPGRSPKWLMVVLPDDPVEQGAIRKQLLDQETSTAFLSDFYQPFDPSHPLVIDDSTKVKTVKKQDAFSNALTGFLTEHGYQLEELRYYPYAARFSYFYLAFSKTDDQLVGLLPTLAPQ